MSVETRIWPATVNDYIEEFKIKDNKGVYTNKNAEFLLIYRLLELLEHYYDEEIDWKKMRVKEQSSVPIFTTGH